MSLIIWSLLMPLNDVTTDFYQPPIFVDLLGLPAHQGKDLSYSSDNIPKQEKLYPEVQPLNVIGDAGAVFFEVLQLAKEQKDWEVMSVNEKDYRLEAVATTALMKYKDDVVIELRTDEQSSDQLSIHMRSRSRVGRSDLGANAKRIQKFLNDLKLKLSQES